MPFNKKKKSKSKEKKSKSAAAGSNKKPAHSKPVARTKTPKKSTKKRDTKKKTPSTTTASRKKSTAVATEREIRQEVQNKHRAAAGAVAGRQSGDLQGLSRAQQADSESVEELVEEGNLFEAGAVAGVEEADNADEREVRTREIPEDDVPEEYLDDK